MRIVIACVLVLILVKKIYGCVYIPGDLYERKNESRHIVCKNPKNYGYSECDYSSVEVLKIENCPAGWIEVDFIWYRNVQTLDISFSNYTTFDYLHLNFDYLKRFNASHNNLTEVHEYQFNNTKQLTEVDFSHNQIKNLHKSTFSKVSKLSTINISHNRIEEMDSGLFSELSDLEVLDLSDNKIEDIPEDAFKKNSKLKTLNLKNNPIWRLDCSITQLLNVMTSINVSFENVIGFDLTCATSMEWAMNEEEIIFKNANSQNELRYPKMKFKNLRTLSIWRNRLHNSLEIVDMLGKSIEDLNLNGNILGKIDETTFHGFNNLHSLYLSETNLSFAAESNPFEHLKKLTELDISYNNLRTLNISSFSKTLSHLEEFLAAGNHIDNGLGIIHSLGSNLLLLDFSQNIIGALNLSTFERFIDMSWLNLSDTHLEHFDVNPLKVSTLDISRNKLKRFNVNLLSDTLNRLSEFCAADNYFENTAEIIQHLGSNLYELDISGNYMGTLNETTFEQTQNIQRLWLQRTNLSISDVKPFETLAIVLEYLDISNNNLTQMSFSTSLVFENLKVIYLRENHLTQLDGLFKHSYPKLTELDITNNQLNCTTYLSMVRTEWESLNIIGKPCGDEDRTQWTTIAPKTSVPPSFSIVSYAVPIGVSALNIIIIGAVVVFLCRKKSSKSSGQMEVSNHSNGNGEELQPEPQQEIESNPEDHIYVEIEERECPYDHLEFGVRPMPISTENQHYQNFTLVNRDRGTRPQNNGEDHGFLDGRREMLPIYNKSTQD